MEFRSRFCSTPEKSFFLFGPRGTGKSTWLRHELPDAVFVDLLKPEIYRELQARPERLREIALGSTPNRTVVVDEVQRVPELLNVVHEVLERPGAPRFVLTGSSARKLRRGGVDLLAGRALLRTLHPFMAAELAEFRLDDALRFGLLPLVVAAGDPEDTLRGYAALYLEQEVQLEGWARSIGNFARFLESISLSHGAVLNVSNVARECQIERKTAAGYVEIIEDLLLGFRVPIFTRRAKRQTAAHPKFYFFDTGVFRTLRPKGPIDVREGFEGAALEGLVAQHLRAWIAYGNHDAKIYYWRTRSGVEVDFVVYGEACFWAIEIKNTTRVRPEDLSGLKSFAADYPECEPLLLYRGREHLKIDSIQCHPVEEFLRELKPSRLIASDIAQDTGEAIEDKCSWSRLRGGKGRGYRSGKPL
jgi:predicted AAA+ superfamily ATPase